MQLGTMAKEKGKRRIRRRGIEGEENSDWHNPTKTTLLFSGPLAAPNSSAAINTPA